MASRTIAQRGGQQAGPERPVFLENVMTFFRIPYGVGCLLVALGLGTGGSVIARYLDTFDMILAAQAGANVQGGVPIWQSILGGIVWTVLTFYAFYIVRYVRLKVLAAEGELVSLCPLGEGTFHKVFDRLSEPRPPMILSAVIIGGYTPLILGYVRDAVGPFHAAFIVLSQALISVALGTFLWVYFSSLKGLHNLGKEPLKLKAYYEDGMFGLRPMGALSFNITYAFLVAVGLFALALSLSPDPYNVAVLSVFVVVGVAMFFLPLNSIHKTMREAKRGEQASVRNRFAELIVHYKDSNPNDPRSSFADLRERLTEVRAILALDITDRKVASLPTWPFDTGLLGKLTVITLSVTAISISNVIRTIIFPLFGIK